MLTLHEPLPPPPRMIQRLLPALACALLLAGCATTEAERRAQAPIPQNCGRTSLGYAPLALDESEAAAVDTRRLPLPARAIETARLIGALPALAHWASLQQQDADLATTLAARQQLMDRLHLANLEVAAVLAEIDCEDERNDQLRDRLQGRENRRLRQLTVAGIVVGASTAIGSAALGLAGEAHASNVVGLVGGVAEVGIGLAGLDEGEAAVLMHPRNVLRDVWQGTDAQQNFPPAVWRYLQSRPDPAQPRTLREQLIAQWQQEDWLGAPGSALQAHRTELFFGPGGRYTIADLLAREALLDTLQARIAIFNQDIAALLRDLIQANRSRP